MSGIEEMADQIMHSVAEQLAFHLTLARPKEPEQLTELERLAVAIHAGVPYEFTQTGIRVNVPFGIQKIDGQFRVAWRAATSGESE